MQVNAFNFLDDTLLIEDDNDNKHAVKARRTRRKRRSRMNELEARRAVEELMITKHYQSYENLYDY